MNTSRRLTALGSGVFARNDARKQAHRIDSASGGAPDLVDLSLGSSDLRPPEAVLAAMARGLQHPSSASYCLQSATALFREAVSHWCQQRFGVEVDPEREVQLLSDRRKERPIYRWPSSIWRRRLASRPPLSLPPWRSAAG